MRRIQEVVKLARYLVDGRKKRRRGVLQNFEFGALDIQLEQIDAGDVVFLADRFESPRRHGQRIVIDGLPIEDRTRAMPPCPPKDYIPIMPSNCDVEDFDIFASRKTRGNLRICFECVDGPIEFACRPRTEITAICATIEDYTNAFRNRTR